MSLRIVAIDPGDAICGLSVLDDGLIAGAFNLENSLLWPKLKQLLAHSNCVVAVEDIRAYSGQLSQNVIDTCKFIGELRYRLRRLSGEKLVFIPRSHVKKWVWDTFPEVCGPLIDKKIDKKVFWCCDLATREEIKRDNKGRKAKKGSHNYVDDFVVQAAMKYMWKLEKEPGKKSWPFGLATHSWQSLATSSFYMRSTTL